MTGRVAGMGGEPARAAADSHGTARDRRPGGTRRLFVAITPPLAVLDELAAATAPLRDQAVDLRWTDPEAWHVTLAFLGEVDDTAAARLAARLGRAAARHRRFALAFAAAGAFPRAERARVLWTGVDGDRASLGVLAAAVTAAARRAGAAPASPERPFRPHLTLARCRVPTDVRGIVAALDGYRGAPWTVDAIQLIHSRPGRQPRFIVVGNWSLAAATAGRDQSTGPVRTG